eukprot:TRINITY_DN19478_c0_g1_i6.p1 TRINITY_DN19478_c0_g1~~TRINITY_DN19478_c0_g1_i6.p1  ORF type:complete len:893 (-),score=312.29 TRINITY_DN19478_c0_g1_i6:242-2920(-)
MLRSLVGSEMCIRDRVSTQSTGKCNLVRMSQLTDRLAQGEKVDGGEVIDAIDTTIDELKAETEKILDSQAVTEIKQKATEVFEEASQYLDSEDAQGKIKEAKDKVEELATKALGDEIVDKAKKSIDKIEAFMDSDEAQELKESLLKIKDTDIPQDVKDKIVGRTGQLWDKLSQDDKTRELTATLVSAIGAQGESLALGELKDKLFSVCDDKEKIGSVLGEVQELVQRLASDTQAQQQIMEDGGKVWDKIEQNEEVWSLLRESKDLLGGLNVGKDEKILDNAQVKALTVKGEKILDDLAQTEETQRLIARTKEMCGSIWDQLQLDIGLDDTKIEDFLQSGQEIWDKIDGQVLKAAVGTLLKSLLELVLEFVPSLELPRVNGFYSSPVGEVCYQIAGMQFSTFAFSPEGVQIDVDKKLTVRLEDISAEVRDFEWQFAKSSWPFITGEGQASVNVSEATVHLEYSLEYSKGRVAITIDKQDITMKTFNVSVAEATAGWLYNMILNVLNNRLRSLLESKLLELAVTKLAELSSTVNDLSQGFLSISLCEELQTAVAVQQEDVAEEQRALRVLMDAFHSSTKLGKEIFRIDALSIAPFLASLPGVPKVILFSSHDTIPPLYEHLFRTFHEGLLFGHIPAGNDRLQKEYAVDTLPCLQVVTHELPRPIRFRANINLEELTLFLSHFCISFGKVSPVSNFSMDFFLKHAPPDSSIVLLFTERDDLPPLYIELAKNFRMFLFAIIRHTETQMVEKFNITKYPTLMVMPRPDKPPIQYKGDIVPKDVHNFFAHFVMDMNSIVRINTYTIDVFLDREKRKPHIILFTSHNDIPRLYEDLWRKFHFYMCFAIIIAPEQELMTRFQVGGLPKLLASTDGHVTNYEGQITAKGVFDFLNGFATIR